jgi:hypothetical protein
MSRVDVLNLSHASKETTEILWARTNPEMPAENQLPKNPELILDFILFEGVTRLIPKLMAKIKQLKRLGLAAKICDSHTQVSEYEDVAARYMKNITSHLDKMKAYRQSIEEDEAAAENRRTLNDMGWDGLTPSKSSICELLYSILTKAFLSCRKMAKSSLPPASCNCRIPYQKTSSAGEPNAKARQQLSTTYTERREIPGLRGIPTKQPISSIEPT